MTSPLNRREFIKLTIAAVSSAAAIGGLQRLRKNQQVEITSGNLVTSARTPLFQESASCVLVAAEP